MKRKDIILLGTVAGITAIISLVLSSLVFKVPVSHNLKVVTAQSVSTSFPDINNDPNYSAIFNKSALDPAQPLQLGGQSNNTPFNGSP